MDRADVLEGYPGCVAEELGLGVARKGYSHRRGESLWKVSKRVKQEVRSRLTTLTLLRSGRRTDKILLDFMLDGG